MKLHVVSGLLVVLRVPVLAQSPHVRSINKLDLPEPKLEVRVR
jgi:hypothetical protein